MNGGFYDYVLYISIYCKLWYYVLKRDPSITIIVLIHKIISSHNWLYNFKNLPSPLLYDHFWISY